MKKKNKQIAFNNKDYVRMVFSNESAIADYENRMMRICLSMFEWVNLPESMNQRFLEKSLYFFGRASLLYSEKYGYINLNCASDGFINLYDLPTKLNCYSHDLHFTRDLYTGNTDKRKDEECILVLNNYDYLPTYSTIQLFAQKLAECDMTMNVNLKAQKTPVLILTSDEQRLTMENLYNQYDGNKPMIFGDGNVLNMGSIKAIDTKAPYVIDKISEYKKEIWNEFLTFIGVNNVAQEKKERLVSDEVNQNNELINYNLQSFLAPRQEACKQFNEKFGLVGTDKEISVRIRSDLHNIIKNEESVITGYNKSTEDGDVDE